MYLYILCSDSMGLLLALLKATIKLMHKLAPIVSEMLMNKPDSSSIDEPFILNWPDDLQNSTHLDRREWTGRQLSELEQTCEYLLTQGI